MTDTTVLSEEDRRKQLAADERFVLHVEDQIRNAGLDQGEHPVTVKRGLRFSGVSAQDEAFVQHINDNLVQVSETHPITVKGAEGPVKARGQFNPETKEYEETEVPATSNAQAERDRNTIYAGRHLGPNEVEEVDAMTPEQRETARRESGTVIESGRRAEGVQPGVPEVKAAGAKPAEVKRPNGNGK